MVLNTERDIFLNNFNDGYLFASLYPAYSAKKHHLKNTSLLFQLIILISRRMIVPIASRINRIAIVTKISVCNSYSNN